MKLSDKELSTQQLDQDTVASILGIFEQQGFVVIEEIYEQALVEEMLQLSETVLNRKNKNSAALPYELLHRRPFAQLAANSIVKQVSDELRKNMDFRDDYPRIRRCPPGESGVARRVHRDTNDARELMLSVDLLLTDFTPENGATEIWPGTQHTKEGSEEEYRAVEDRADSTPFVYVEGPAGSVSFRDGRTWHRAGTNNTDSARIMLSLG